MTLDEILGNKELGDDFEITLGDHGSFKLGDLRSINGERDSLRTEREAISSDRDRIRTEYDKQSSTLAGLIAEAGKRADQDIAPPDPREAMLDAMRKLVAPNDPSAPLFEDKMFGAAFNRLREDIGSVTDGKLKAVNDQLEALKGLIEKSNQSFANAHLYEREQRWWNDVRNEVPSIDGKKLTLQQLKDYATQTGVYVPGTQFIDYDRALDMISAPVRAKQELEKAQEEAYQKGLIAGRTGKAQVLPLFGERSGGANGVQPVDTKGKAPRQFMKEAVTRGLQDVMAGNE